MASYGSWPIGEIRETDFEVDLKSKTLEIRLTTHK